MPASNKNRIQQQARGCSLAWKYPLCITQIFKNDRHPKKLIVLTHEKRNILFEQGLTAQVTPPVGKKQRPKDEIDVTGAKAGDQFLERTLPRHDLHASVAGGDLGDGVRKNQGPTKGDCPDGHHSFHRTVQCCNLGRDMSAQREPCQSRLLGF
jgi:hypothetical protein